MTFTCKICGSSLNSRHLLAVKEMMFLTNNTFNYYLCDSCGCLQIDIPPDDIGKYYPENYYAHTKSWSFDDKRAIKFKIRAKIAGKFFYPLYRSIDNVSILNFINNAKLKTGSKILDVGCGNGDLLYEFYRYGFNNLTGIDPFLREEFHNSSINLYKGELEDLKDKFDFIIFNHSFEHIWEQQKTLNKAKELLSDDGTLLVRIPLINYAFEKYKEYWVQLDAPRHFFLHSEKSFNMLCEECGLVVRNVFYDSTDFQFIGSEQYLKSISMTADNSYYVNPQKSIFKDTDIKKFQLEAKRLNKKNQGDQASFFIKKGS